MRPGGRNGSMWQSTDHRLVAHRTLEAALE